MNIETIWQCCARLKYVQSRQWLPTDLTLCLLTFCVHIIVLLSLRVTCVILNLMYLTLYVAVLSIVRAGDPAIYRTLTKYTGCIFYAFPALQLSRDVPEDAGFMCDKASLLRNKIKERDCMQ